MTFIYWQKINFILHVFLEILQRHCKLSHAFLEIFQRYGNFLFWVIWTCLVTQTQDDTINLLKTSVFTCMPKIYFIIHFFLEILHSKESCNWLKAFWLITQEPEFCQISYWWWYTNNSMSSHFRLFLRKMIKFFKKSKNPYFGAILNPFYPNLGKNEFSWKNGLCQFLKIPIIYLCRRSPA